jgi:photosystem II stability/assembly factor-like uncharacterized protein
MSTRRVGGLVLVAVAALVVAGCTPWASQSVPSGTPDLFGISCPSTTHCVAVGGGPDVAEPSAIATTDNGGATWSTQQLPTATAQLTSVSCPTTTNCVAVGGGFASATPATILTSSDGGSTWVSRPAPSGFEFVQGQGVSCASSTDCVAVGSPVTGSGATTDVLATTDGGATWVSHSTGPIGLSSVSCASTTNCVAVNYSNLAYTTTDGGATWTSHAVVPSPALPYLDAVSCPSTSFCVAGGGQGNESAVLFTTTDGGSTWVSQTPPSPTPGGIASISCVSTTECVAAGGGTQINPGGGLPVAISVTFDAGANWISPTIPSVANLLGVSCPSPTSCTAVGFTQGNGQIIRTG